MGKKKGSSETDLRYCMRVTVRRPGSAYFTLGGIVTTSFVSVPGLTAIKPWDSGRGKWRCGILEPLRLQPLWNMAAIRCCPYDIV
jgi:hypothetical protein